MLKTIYSPHLGRHVKMGRRRPVARGPRLHLKNYLRLSLPAAPASCDYSPKATASLSLIYLNDQLGDCVIAGGYHVVGVETGNAGKIFLATDPQIVAEYGAIGGYNPADPNTDQGCDEQTALNYWTETGFVNGTKLLGWLAVDGTNKAEVMAALYLFENVYFGVELPNAWVNPMPSAPGFVWDVAGDANPSNGHCFMAVGYTDKGVLIDTWGMIGLITWEAVAKYASKAGQGELYTLLSPDQLGKAQTRAPNGFEWTDLIADFDAMGGNVPVPAPAPTPDPTPPTPTPNPTPTPTPDPAPTPPTPAFVTLEQAQAWAVIGLALCHRVMTRRQAETVVMQSLAEFWPSNDAGK